MLLLLLKKDQVRCQRDRNYSTFEQEQRNFYLAQVSGRSFRRFLQQTLQLEISYIQFKNILLFLLFCLICAQFSFKTIFLSDPFPYNNIIIKNKMQGSKFFKTQSQQILSDDLSSKKRDLRSYVSNIDIRLNKAMRAQNLVLNKKKSHLIQTLERMKDQVHRQYERPRKMQEFFYQFCEKILKEDISKWDSNKQFFSKIFQLYDHKIKQKKAEILTKRKQVQQKSLRLKQIMKANRKSYTVEQFYEKLSNESQQLKTKKTLQTSQTSIRMTRVKTQASLPSLEKANMRQRVRTIQNSEAKQQKNYMKPIKTQKLLDSSSSRQQLLQMLNWYRSQKKDYCWFQKVIFVERNFSKIVKGIACQID